MTQAPDKRRTELMLLVAMLLVTTCGLALVFFGKAATTTLPPNPVNINTATSGQMAQALSVSAVLGKALVAERGHGFAAVYDLRHSKVLKNIPTTPIDARFIARTPQQVALGFWGEVALYLISFIAAHLLLRKAAPKADPFLLPLVALLSGIGLMLIYTVKDPYRDTFAFSGQAWNIALFGLIALAVPLSRPFARLTLRRYQYAYAASSVVLMLLLLIAGHGPGGIRIRLLGFEPIEIIKVLLVFFVVSYLTERRGMLGDPKTPLKGRDFGPLAVIYLFTLFLFVLVKDLGPAVLLFGAFLTLLYLTTQRAIYPIVGTLLLIGAAVAGYMLHFGFFATRVTMWLHPWDNADPRGAQLADGLWGMATGGVWGSGLGLGDPQFMPRSGSDLIFATLGEELGLIGTLTVLIVYVLIIGRGFQIAARAGTEFDRMLAAGLTTLLALQTMIIVGGVTGFVPLTGITLPFISFGGSSLVANFFLIGILLYLSGKTLPDEAIERPSPEWLRAARVVALGCSVYLLLGIGAARLIMIQGIQDTQIAARPLITPDADGVRRPHTNPRLLAYAQAIPRGRILDRSGNVLARDAAPEEAGGTSLLTPDGRQRVYPGGAACSQILMAVEAPNGILNPYGRNEALRGYESYASLLGYYRRQNLPFAAHLHGDDVTLTIDKDMQQAALDSLQHYARAVRDWHTGLTQHKGAAVVLNVSTGEILAAASLPTFDLAALTPDRWQTLSQQNNGPLLNRAFNGLYPPGSVFKIVTASSALQHGLENTMVQCSHVQKNLVWRFNGKTYARARVTDEDGFVPHGRTDLSKALRVSCNVYFANLGIKLGAPALDETARQTFDLRHLPSLSKIGEDLPDCAYGQGAILVTPLEMAHVAQTVANNGHLVPVTLWKDPTASANPASPDTPLTSQQSAQLQQMLLGVTQTGTAKGVFSGLNVQVAGKTGSAQNNQGDGVTHSWFAGFAPASNPTLAFACIIENGGAGRSAAAPVCRDILQQALSK